MGMNSKGVFITLATFFLALMLISMSVSLQQVKGIGNGTVNVAIAGERVASLEQNALDSAREVYSKVGKITWSQSDTNFTYYESFPDTASRNAISGQLANANGFLAQEFSNAVGMNLAAIDAGRIYVHGKDVAVRHSATTGFGTNMNLYFDKNTTNFRTLVIDINEAANANNTSSSLPLCGACANPVRLIITWRDTGGVFFSFNNVIDFLQPGSVDIMSSGNEHVIFSYNSSGWQWSTTAPAASLSTRVEFNDAVFEVGPDRKILSVSTLGGYGFSS